MPDAPEDLGHKQVNINSTNLALDADLFGLAAWGLQVLSPLPS